MSTCRLVVGLVILLLTSASTVFALMPRPQLAGSYVAYLPIAEKPASPTVPPTPVPTNTPVPTSTPTPLPPSYNLCAADPYAGSTPNYPVAIVAIDKVAETVTLEGRSAVPVNIADWKICSITGNQLHTSIPGTTLDLGERITLSSQASGPIWNNTSKDDGALYNASGSLVSYWVD